MQRGRDDIILSQSAFNSFAEGQNDFMINDFSFIPSLEIRILNNTLDPIIRSRLASDDDIDIFINKDYDWLMNSKEPFSELIDYDKLSQYI